MTRLPFGSILSVFPLCLCLAASLPAAAQASAPAARPQAASSSKPTVADAQAFMDQAEAELLALATISERAGWIQETYITDDTELLSAKENERLIARTTELIDESKRFDGLQLPPELARKFKLMRLGLTLPAPKDAKLRA
jgi:peptidyl-dipeptidase A